jgi:hypothetical protein
VDVDRIVARERRTVLAWRAGTVAVLVAALAVPVLANGPERSTTARRPPDPAAPAGGPASSGAAPLRLTAADLAAAMPADGDVTTWRMSVGSATPVAPVMGVRISTGTGPITDPCRLAPGATPGRDDAPTTADTCTKVERDGHTVWIRRWGYAPKERPWTTPDTVVVELYFDLRGRQLELILANADQALPRPANPGTVGPKFEISDAELADFAFDLIARNR